MIPLESKHGMPCMSDVAIASNDVQGLYNLSDKGEHTIALSMIESFTQSKNQIPSKVKNKNL